VKTMGSAFTLSNDAFKSFIYYGMLLLGKTVGMSVLTGFSRMAFKSFANPEDTALIGANPEGKGRRFVRMNEWVERVRFRCRNIHLHPI